MATQAYEVERMTARRPIFSAVRWSAVFAGSTAGIATYLMLALLGVAVGLTAIEPEAAQPVGSVPFWTGVWSFISMLIAAFVGAWVAGRMSGLRRRMDGTLHGFVSWGLTTLVFAWLTTTVAAGVLGGAMNAISQSVQAVGQVAGQAGGGAANQLEQLLAGAGGDVTISTEALAALQQELQAQDRSGAMNVMVNQMGFAPDVAAPIVDQAMPLFEQPIGQQAGQVAEQAAAGATSVMTGASWWLFLTLAISLALALWGGAMGSRVNGNRAVHDHSNERRIIHA